MRASAPVLIATALLAFTCEAGAQTRLHNEVDTTLVTVGDRVQLTVSIEHPSDASVVWPDSVDVSPFEVLAARAVPTETSGPRARSAARFTLTAFQLGELEIPSFEVTVLTSDGGREILSTDRFGIEVVSVGSDGTGDIRDIRGPFSIPVSALWIALWVLLLAIVSLGALFGYRRWRRRPGSGTAAPGPAPRPAHELALEALARLDASGMLERGHVKEYHIEASDILRRYVEARYGVRALEMTTWEVIDGLERGCSDASFLGDTRRFLDQCDLVKFAKVRPDAAASRAVLELGRSLVERSTESGARAEPPDGAKPANADEPMTPDAAVRAEAGA